MAAPQKASTCHGGGGIGRQYTYAGLEGLWVNAGGKRSLAPTMAAIAEAESGGCSTAYNASGATGLWQILGAVDPGDQSKLTDPAINAKEAVLKWQTQGLTAWTTYTSGAYKSHLRDGVPPDLKTTGGGGKTATLTAAGANTCLFGVPNFDPLSSLPLIGGLAPNTSFCVVSKSEARAVVGAGILLLGTGFLLVGALVLAAYGLKSEGAGKAAGGALEATGAAVAALGAPEFGVPLAAGGAAVRRQGASRAATGAAVKRGKSQVAAKQTADRQQAAQSGTL